MRGWDGLAVGGLLGSLAEQLQDQLGAGAHGQCVGLDEGGHVDGGQQEGLYELAVLGAGILDFSTRAKTTVTDSSVRPVDEKPGWGSGRMAGCPSCTSP